MYDPDGLNPADWRGNGNTIHVSESRGPSGGNNVSQGVDDAYFTAIGDSGAVEKAAPAVNGGEIRTFKIRTSCVDT